MAVKSSVSGLMGRGGYRWKQVCRLVYATYGYQCHICGHPVMGGVENGGQVDHVVPVCERPDLRFELTNLRPVHGITNRCQDCGWACNQLRGAKPLAYARRKVRTPKPGFTPPGSQSPGLSSPGRDW